jgi:acylaminoacyl-peptidase
VVRAGREGTSAILEFWGQRGIEKELHVPAKLHGSVFADGWFSTGASWDLEEQRIAYVAEVGTPRHSMHTTMKEQMLMAAGMLLL